MNPTGYNNISSNIRITLRCRQHGHGDHGPYEVSRFVLRENSRGLERLLTTSPRNGFAGVPHLILDPAGRGFSCHLLESIIFTWNRGRHERSDPPMDDLEELYQLACALFEYQCSTRWFARFADVVRVDLWEEDQRKGRNASEWAFIAVVFNWPIVFGLSVMDIPYLGQDNPEHKYTGRYEYQTLRQIVRKSTALTSSHLPGG
jgi:hypothetical protein